MNMKDDNAVIALDPQTSTRPTAPEVVAGADCWTTYLTVNDPLSGFTLPDEGHASDDDWADFEVVNDPSSGKVIPNEGHAVDTYNAK